MTNDLWVEKYRPKTLKDCVLSPKIKKCLQHAISHEGGITNLIFKGSAGVGKTTVAKAICNDIGVDEPLFINASNERNIDTLRDKVQQFAVTKPLNGAYQVVILDEADYLNVTSTQPALRTLMEECSDNCRFILTCNYIHKIIDPLRSRCSIIDFNVPPEDEKDIKQKFFERVQNILNQENIDWSCGDGKDKENLARLVIDGYPDFRSIINTLQGSITLKGNQKTIDLSNLVSNQDSKYLDAVIKHIKNKDFESIRGWVDSHKNVFTDKIYKDLYDNTKSLVKDSDSYKIVTIIAKYRFQQEFAVDPDINLAACLAEIMLTND